MKGNENSQDMCPRCMTPLQGHRICPKCKFDPSTYTPAKHHLPPRTILDGKYLVGCVLGEGGFGITYVGWDLQLHTMVAIKEYFPTGIVFRDNTQSNVVSVFSGSGEEHFLHDREKFLEEARMLAKFDGNPGVVSVKNYFKENGTAYIVMEYVQGINLAVLMEQNNDKLPFDRVMKLLELPIKTLGEMHRQSTFHRDISPENLMVTNDNVVKLIDFGSTKTNQKDKSRYLKVRPGYSPLELYTTGGREGPYSDIYALSATIYKAVTGITPPPATDRITDDKLIPPIKAGAKGMSQAQEKALLKGMAVRAQDRYQRVEDLYAGLCGRSARDGGNDKDRGRARKAGPSKKTLAIAAAAVLVVALGLFFLLRGMLAKKKLPEAMFREVPEIYEAYKNGGGEYPFGVRAYVTPDDVFLTGTGEDWRPAEDPELRADLSGKALSETLDDLYGSGLPIETIIFRNLRFETLEPLNRPWPNPIQLMFDCCAMPGDLSPIGGMGDTLTSLHISGGADYSDLSWMSSLTGLEWLALHDGNVDADSIARVSSLKGVSLGGTHIADLSPFATMEHLTGLHLPGNGVSDLSPLAGMAWLEELGLSDNDVSDLSPLAGLENLRYLDVTNNHIEDFSPVERDGLEIVGRDRQTILLPESLFREVPEIYEAYRGSGDYPYGVRAYVTPDDVFLTDGSDDWRETEDPELRADLSGKALSETLDGLYGSGLPIEILVFRNLRFETLEPLNRPWPCPTQLIFDACTLPGDLSPIGGMGDTLTSLHIGGEADLSDLSWMTSLTGLSWLALGGEGMDVDSIARVSSLAGVSLGGAHITDVAPFAAMPNLTGLNLPGNDVSDLSPLAGMAGLRELGLPDNDVSDLSPLAGLENLRYLDVTNNHIEDFSPVDHVPEVYGRDAQRFAAPETLTQSMFAEAPELWEAYASGGEYPYSARAILSPDGVRIVDHASDPGEPDPNAVRKAVDGDLLARAVNALTGSGVPIDEIALYSLDLETLEPLAGLPRDRDWSLRILECGLPGDLPILARLGDCLTGLTLYTDSTLDDLSWLTGLNRLYHLHLVYRGDGDPGALDVASIGRIGSLRYLYLNGWSLTDASALGSLTELSSLGLGTNQIEDLGFVADMERLSWLDLNNNRVTDLGALDGHGSLDTLDISDNQVRDLSPLQGDYDLTHLYLAGNYIRDFAAVDHVPDVRGKGEQQVEDYGYVEPMALTEDMFAAVPDAWRQYSAGETVQTPLRAAYSPDGGLVFEDNNADFEWQNDCEAPRSDLSAEQLAGVVNALYDSRLNVQRLELNYWNLESVSPLHRPWYQPLNLSLSPCVVPDDWSALGGMGDTLENLVVCGHFRADDLSWMASLTGLRSLDLTIHTFSSDEGVDCRLDLASIGQMTQLEALYLQNWRLTDADALSGLVNLEYLSLHNNKLTNVSVLANMPRLSWLMISMNGLEDLSPLSGLKSLRNLGIDINCVSDLSPLSGLTMLSHINLGENYIEDFGPIERVGEVEGRDRQFEGGKATFELTEDMFGPSHDIWDHYRGDQSYPYAVYACITPWDVEFREYQGYHSLREDEENSRDEPWEQRFMLENDCARWDLRQVLETIRDSGLPVSGIRFERLRLASAAPIADIWPADRPVALAFYNCGVARGGYEALGGMGDGLLSLTVSGDCSKIDGFSWLIPCHALEELVFSPSEYGRRSGWEPDCSGLADLDCVRSLGLTWMNLAQVPGSIRDMESLVSLNFNGCRLTDISALRGMRLEDLGLASNHNLTDLSPLEGMDTLRSLQLTSCLSLGDANLPDGLSLTRLNIEGTNRSDVSALAAQTGLEELYMGWNSIGDISALAELPNLREVSLEHNHITDFSPVDRGGIVVYGRTEQDN